MITRERVIWVVIAVTIGASGYFIGKKSQPIDVTKKEAIVEVKSESTDVSNEIDKSFGWAKAQPDINVEAVDIVKGLRKAGDEYSFPSPAVKFAIKNNGESDIESFGVNMVVLDELNKRKIAAYGQASGSIQKGWTSDRMLFEVMQSSWRDTTGNEKISFPVTFIFSAKTQGGGKELFRVQFDPVEFDSLPEINF